MVAGPPALGQPPSLCRSRSVRVTIAVPVAHGLEGLGPRVRDSHLLFAVRRSRVTIAVPVAHRLNGRDSHLFFAVPVPCDRCRSLPCLVVRLEGRDSYLLFAVPVPFVAVAVAWPLPLDSQARGSRRLPFLSRSRCRSCGRCRCDRSRCSQARGSRQPPFLSRSRCRSCGRCCSRGSGSRVADSYLFFLVPAPRGRSRCA